MSITQIKKKKNSVNGPKKKGFIHPNSTITCGQCRAMFPLEYLSCPQCEVDDLWNKIKVQYTNDFGE